MKQNIYSLKTPKSPLPLVFDSPHSGTHYPNDFNYSCNFEDLKRSEDQYVDHLFDTAPNYGASLLCALFPRCYIDTNRAPCDIDTNLLNTPWDREEHGPINPTARSDAGIGLIRRLVKPGIPVYDRDLNPTEILQRLENYYRPYHKILEMLIDEAHYNFGQVWHINCHSMPSSSARPRQITNLIGGSPKSADFVLGDRDGTTAEKEFTHTLRDCLKELGYTVTINDPFKGVELVRRYSAPTRGRHSIQLEINKALYMNETTGEKNKAYTALRNDTEKLIATVAEYVKSNLIQLAAD